jgi:hypothetical protein
MAVAIVGYDSKGDWRLRLQWSELHERECKAVPNFNLGTKFCYVAYNDNIILLLFKHHKKNLQEAMKVKAKA